MTVFGHWTSEVSIFQAMLDLLRDSAGNIDFEGRVTGSLFLDDDVEIMEHEIRDLDPFDVALRHMLAGSLHSVNCRFDIDGVVRYYAFRAFPNRVVVEILANRMKLADGVVDFNWYYLYWGSKFDGVMRIGGVEFSDIT